jgi:hypothetical protein
MNYKDIIKRILNKNVKGRDQEKNRIQSTESHNQEPENTLIIILSLNQNQIKCQIPNKINKDPLQKVENLLLNNDNKQKPPEEDLKR